MKSFIVAALIWSFLGCASSFAIEPAKGDSQIMCERDAKAEAAIDKLNQTLLYGKTEVFVKILSKGPGLGVHMTLPITTSAPFVLHDGSSYLACVTVTKI